MDLLTRRLEGIGSIVHKVAVGEVLSANLHHAIGQEFLEDHLLQQCCAIIVVVEMVTLHERPTVNITHVALTTRTEDIEPADLLPKHLDDLLGNEFLLRC